MLTDWFITLSKAQAQARRTRVGVAQVEGYAVLRARDRQETGLTITPAVKIDGNGSAPPGEQSSPDYHSNGQLWTVLWPDGQVIFKPGGPGSINADGSLSMK